MPSEHPASLEAGHDHERKLEAQSEAGQGQRDQVGVEQPGATVRERPVCVSRVRCCDDVTVSARVFVCKPGERVVDGRQNRKCHSAARTLQQVDEFNSVFAND